MSVALWALIVAAKLVKRRPDGRILSDEDEAAELAAKQARRLTNRHTCALLNKSYEELFLKNMRKLKKI